MPAPVFTWNPADKGGSVVLGNGNLDATVNFVQNVRATFGQQFGVHAFQTIITAINSPNSCTKFAV